MATQLNRGGGPVDVWTREPITPFAAEPEAGRRSPLERLQDTFLAHSAGEADTVAAYQRLAETSADPVVALLMQLVVDDEGRHHGLLNRMAARLRATLEWIAVPGALPTGEATAPPPAEFVAALQSYVHQEEEGARHLRRLAAEQKDVYGGLFTVLLETMALDSEKHAHILRYLLRRARDQAAS